MKTEKILFFITGVAVSLTGLYMISTANIRTDDNTTAAISQRRRRVFNGVIVSGIGILIFNIPFLFIQSQKKSQNTAQIPISLMKTSPVEESPSENVSDLMRDILES